MKAVLVLVAFSAFVAITQASNPTSMDNSASAEGLKHVSALTGKSRSKRFIFPMRRWFDRHSSSSSSSSESRSHSSSRERSRRILRPYLDPMGYVFKSHHHHHHYSSRSDEGRGSRRMRKYLIRKDQLMSALATNQQFQRSKLDVGPALIKLDSRK